jgi:hypothetical protein
MLVVVKNTTFGDIKPRGSLKSFQRSMLLPSLMSKNNAKQDIGMRAVLCYLLLSGFLLALLFNPEGGSDIRTMRRYITEYRTIQYGFRFRLFRTEIII